MGYIEPPTPGFHILNNTLYLLLLPPMTPMRGAMRRRSPPGGVIKGNSLEVYDSLYVITDQ